MSTDETRTAPPAGGDSSAARSARGHDDSPSRAARADGQRRKEKARAFFERNPAAKGVLVGLVALVLLGALIWWWTSRGWERTDDAQIDGHIYPISAHISGQVSKVLVDDGQSVQAGAVLVQIDPREYQIGFDRAQAEYAESQANFNAANFNVPISQAGSTSQIATAEAEVSTAKAGVAAAKKLVEQAEAQLVEARANAAKLNADLERYQRLIEKREISQQQFDQARAAATAGNAAVTRAEAGVRASQEQVAQANARLRQAEAALLNARTSPKQVSATEARAKSAEAQAMRAKAALDQAQLNLGYTTISSPVAGVVGRRSVQPGQNVQPAQELMSVVALDEVWVTANFKETQLRQMRPGQEAELAVDTYGRSWKGRVTWIGGATGAKFSLLPPENATGNFVKVVQRIPVRIDLEPGANREGQLRPGMSVDARVKIR